MKNTFPNPMTRWFDTKNNKQVAFTSSVILIGVLFVVAIVAIFLQKGPSADEVTSPIGRLAKRVTLGNGSLGYSQGGSTKTKPSNSVDVRIKAVPKITFQLQGLNKANQVTGITSAITVKTVGGQDIVASPLTATGTAGISTKQFQSAFDSDDYRNSVNGTNADLKIKVTVPNYLSQTVTVSDPKTITLATPFVAGNFVNSGDSTDVIDEADTAKCGPAFKQAVTDANKVCDVNFDGQIDEADTAIWGPNFGQKAKTQ